MLEKVKKFGIILTIAVLFAFFSFSIVDVVMESPEYEDFCGTDIRPVPVVPKAEECPFFEGPTELEEDDCDERKGRIEYKYDAQGCVQSYECNTCWTEYDEAGKQHRLVGFIVTSFLGIIAVLVGLYAKSKKEVVEWIYSGFLIGGIISIFIGTMSYFRDMGRFFKPIVFLIEIILIILIALKTASRKK
jgi:hypothetical protein